jgi:hypothetical protein
MPTKRPNKPARSESDYGTPERRRRGHVVVRPVEPGPGYATVDAAMDMHATVLDMLYAKGKLGGGDTAKRRFEAGEWLLACFTRAGLNPSTTMRYSPLGREGGEDISDMQAWNRRAYNEALRAMGVYAQPVAAAVVYGQYRDAVHDMLCGGLDLLADFRGL